MNEDIQNKKTENQSAAEERQLRKQIALEKAASHKSQARVIIIVASVVLIVALTFLIITVINNHKKEQYSQAIELLNAGNYSAAYDKLLGIRDYGNVSEIISQNEGIQALIKSREEVLKKFKTKGSVVTFGNYEGEDIQWLVISANEDRCQLISKGNVFHSNMHEVDDWKYKKGFAWETSIVRETLNNKFLKESFSESEQRAILKVKDDKVYIVSSPSEARRLLPNTEDLLVYRSSGYIDPYWTASKAHSMTLKRNEKEDEYDKFLVYVVKDDDDDSRFDYTYAGSSEGVRPIIWVDLTSNAIYERVEAK